MLRLINPVSGRRVLRSGRIGRRLIRAKQVVTDEKRYRKVVELWNWWSRRSPYERQRVAQKWWDTRLNDMEYGKYPFYLMDYERVLKRAKRTFLGVFKRTARQ